MLSKGAKSQTQVQLYVSLNNLNKDVFNIIIFVTYFNTDENKKFDEFLYILYKISTDWRKNLLPHDEYSSADCNKHSPLLCDIHTYFVAIIQILYFGKHAK